MVISAEENQLEYIADLSTVITKLEMERQALGFSNVGSGVSLDDRLEIGRRCAVNEAKLMKAIAKLKQAQEEYAAINGEYS